MFKVRSKVTKDTRLHRLIIFNTFTLGVFIEKAYGLCYALILGIGKYEIHLQFRKWSLKPFVVNTGIKSDA